MEKYYLHNGTEQIGPFTLEELKTKNVGSNTPVWYAGIDKWTTVGNVEELKGIVDTVKPPTYIPPTQTPPPYLPPTPPKVTPPQQQPVSTTVQQKSKSSLPTVVIVILIIFAIIGYIALKNNPNSIPGLKVEINTPKPRVLTQSANADNSNILKMKEKVSATIINDGGNGNILVSFHLVQDGKTYDRTQTISFIAGESKDVEASFDEVRRLGGDMQYSVDARPE